jgi:hypothetical protein
MDFKEAIENEQQLNEEQEKNPQREPSARDWQSRQRARGWLGWHGLRESLRPGLFKK